MRHYEIPLSNEALYLEQSRINYISRKAMGVYANILLDDWFKRTFEELPGSKRLLTLLLQELIPERKIVDIKYAPQEHTNPNPDKRGIRVDVEATDATILDNFCFSLHNMQSLEERPAELRQEIFELLFEAANIAKFAPEDKIKYEFDMTTERDIRNQIRYAEKKGVEKGIAVGQEKERQENARNLKSLGVAIDTIAQATGLSEEQIKAL